MALTTSIKNKLNYLLKHIGIEIHTTNNARAEARRLSSLPESHFTSEIFPVCAAFINCKKSKLLKEVKKIGLSWNSKITAAGVFDINNEYYTSPDAEILVALVQKYKPKKILEIGSGNSTRLFKSAIIHINRPCKIISIDPQPRADISQISDQVIKKKFESVSHKYLFKELKANDMLFIDSSHEVKTGNDVTKLLLNVLPQLRKGVIIHIHDIFLPYEYPKEWVVNKKWPWNEQYLVQALLYKSQEYKVLWAGHYFQRSMPEFAKYFPLWKGRNASSLWLKKL